MCYHLAHFIEQDSAGESQVDCRSGLVWTKLRSYGGSLNGEGQCKQDEFELQ